MASSLKDMVSAIAPTIPTALIQPEALTEIAAVAQHLPLTLGTTVGFECPLSTPGKADFFLRVSGAWGQSLLAGQPQMLPVLDQLSPESHLLPLEFAHLWQNAPWQSIRQFARQWAEPTSQLHQVVEDIWLEFDIASGGDSMPLPSVFFGVKPEGPSDLDWVSQTALPTLLGQSLQPQTEETLQCCLRAIPNTAELFQVGLLSGRTSTEADVPAIRLYIRNLTLAEVRSLLHNVSWPGDPDLLAALLQRVSTGTRRFTLQLEIQATLSPVIAVECMFASRPEWHQVLDRLVVTGFCSRDRAQALLDYPGYVRAKHQVAPFPALLKNWSTQLAPYRECVLVKRLAYLKFTYQPGQPLLAKAYLGLSPTWIDARYLEPKDPYHQKLPDQETLAVGLCKALIQQLDYGEIDVDALVPCTRSQKSRLLNQTLETLCIGG
ncbi:MAG TPA: hypothetical protein V6D06_12120 [Trichocoleus sp.]